MQRGIVGNKTSQLQIRVSPEEKRTLKRLAAAAGMSVSKYVLSTALPTQRAEFTRRALELSRPGDRTRALAELRSFLARLAPEELATSVAALDLADLPPVLQNHVAAAVEHAAWVHDQHPPAWTRDVEPLDRPHFARDLRSLRPNLMRVTPITYKRRNAFVELESEVTRQRMPSRPRVPLAFARLDEELGRRGVLAELCTSGGALFMLAFDAHPPTRNVTALFQPLERLEEAIGVVTASEGRPPRWPAEEARACVGVSAMLDGFLELPNLRVYEARPEYLLAMKCAALRTGVTPTARDDIRHLVRSLNLLAVDDALGVVERYFTPRQLPDSVRDVLAGALGAPTEGLGP